MSELTLADFKQGQRGFVQGYREQKSPYRQKLLAMGLVPGTAFTVLRRAPLGDPIEVSLRGYVLSLRKEEIQILMVATKKDPQ